jgi:hypothetical protein
MEERVSEAVNVPPVNDDAMWRAHISYAKDFMGSDSEYCRRNKLSHRVFRHYKKKFGATRPRVLKEKSFVRVEAAGTVRRSPVATLPNPEWTAQFIAALVSTTR